MKYDVTTVDQYLEKIPPDRKAALIKLREVCRETLQSFDEAIAYGGPCYVRAGEIEVGFGSQKHFIGLYTQRLDVFDRFRDRFKAKGISLGRSVIRYSSPDKIDLDLVRAYLEEIETTTGPIGSDKMVYRQKKSS